MADRELVLVVDQGTTSSRVCLYNRDAHLVASAQAEFDQFYPHAGWVEHDAEQIWDGVCALIEEALRRAGAEGRHVRAIGITNQRETTVLWHRQTGRPLARAIVWQDRRTAEFCRQHQDQEPWLWQRSGLVLDPYFSATKMKWLLDHAAADTPRQLLALGTMDSFLIWKLTSGRRHVTDVTNASRTLLLNVRTGSWDDELCEFFQVPRSTLPEVLPSCADFGATFGLSVLPDGIPILGVAGDQQASLFGQGCWQAGTAKCTYGTGAFLLLHTGAQPVWSKARLLTTLVASPQGTLQYAVEGSLFIAGAAIQWLRDGLGILKQASDVDRLAQEASDSSELVFIPALVGFGAPHWVPQARGTLFGITRATTAADLVRATLQGVALQVHDLIGAIAADFPDGLQALRADGGMSRSDYFLQLQADVLGLPVDRVAEAESTALGAALLAGWGAGWWQSFDELQQAVHIAQRFLPKMEAAQRDRLIERWQKAVRTTIQHFRP